MKSEINNIKNGIVVQTQDYEDSKRIIGISNATVTSVNGGVPPLSKQNAFTVEEIKAEVPTNQQQTDLNSIPAIDLNFQQPQVSQQTIESVNTAVPPSQHAEEIPTFVPTDINLSPSSTIIPNQETNIEKPVQTNNPGVLESLMEDVTAVGNNAVNKISNTINNLENLQQSPNDMLNSNIELPTIDVPVVAEEPSENDSTILFNEKSNDEPINNAMVDNTLDNTNQKTLKEEDASFDTTTIVKAVENRKKEISQKIANYMTAASNMLVDEIVEMVKIELSSLKTKENLNKDVFAQTEENNSNNNYTLNL
ncbi:MAG: hypothetical protein PUE43_03995 [Clostridium sp.]|nr:hypothetical protein [Clostridium sp.]